MHGAGSFVHVPPVVHVCTVFPLHCLAPGVHALHSPSLQTGLHAIPLLAQVPEASQACGWLPLHCFEPGVHMPVHIAFVQTKAHEEMGFHPPVASHASCVGEVGLHRRVPGTHEPPHLSPAHRKSHALPASQPPLAWQV
jgi:hypothetical protein